MSERRVAITAELARKTGIDDQMIEHLVFTFYGKVRADTMLGPIFEERIEDWPRHLDRMYAFWSSVALMTGRYHGQPMQKHQPLPIDGRHFDHWLSMFEETATEECPPAAAAHFIQKARGIAESLELGVASHLGVRLKTSERLLRPDDDVHLAMADPTVPPDGEFSSPACAMPEVDPGAAKAPKNRREPPARD